MQSGKTPLSEHHEASTLPLLQPYAIFMTATLPLVRLRGRRFSSSPLQSRISQCFICIPIFSPAKINTVPPYCSLTLPSLCHDVSHVSLLFQLPDLLPSLAVFPQ